MKNKLYIFGFGLILLIVLSLYGMGALNVAKIVNAEGTHSSVSSAFNACNAARADQISDGNMCDACALVAGASSTSKLSKNPDGTYDFDYGSSRIRSGVFEDLSVDYIDGVRTPISSHASSNPSFYYSNNLEVKSYCNNRIRQCMIQTEDGDVVSTQTTKNGKIQKVEFEYGWGECGSDDVQTYVGTATRYKLICDSGYTSVRYIGKSLSDLGVCESGSESQQRGEGMDGSFSSSAIPDRVEASEEVNLRAVFVAEEAGTYLVSGRIGSEDDLLPLSVSTSFSASNPCGAGGRQRAGSFVSLAKGDQAVVDLSVVAPSAAGEYKVQLLASDSCGMLNVYDNVEQSVIVQAEEQFRDTNIEEVISDEPEFYNDYLKDLISKTSSAIDNGDFAGCSDEDLIVDGCKIAYCDAAGEVQLYSDVVCDNGETIKGNELLPAFNRDRGFGEKLFYFGEGGYGKISTVVIAVLFFAGIVYAGLSGGRRK